MARKASAYAKCVGRQLKGKMKGKNKTARQAQFRKAAKTCKRR